MSILDDPDCLPRTRPAKPMLRKIKGKPLTDIEYAFRQKRGGLSRRVDHHKPSMPRFSWDREP
jgi:hypothetical protein